MTKTPYHYTESGLDNVWIIGGVHERNTPYGKAVSIEHTEALHRTIGKWLIDLPKPLNGAELRFLRLEMEETQRDLAALLGTTEQTLRLWEKHRKKAIPQGSADRLLRAIYAERTGRKLSVASIMERLSKLNELMRKPQAHIRETKRGWNVEARC